VDAFQAPISREKPDSHGVIEEIGLIELLASSEHSVGER